MIGVFSPLPPEEPVVKPVPPKKSEAVRIPVTKAVSAVTSTIPVGSGSKFPSASNRFAAFLPKMMAAPGLALLSQPAPTLVSKSPKKAVATSVATTSSVASKQVITKPPGTDANPKVPSPLKKTATPGVVGTAVVTTVVSKTPGPTVTTVAGKIVKTTVTTAAGAQVVSSVISMSTPVRPVAPVAVVHTPVTPSPMSAGTVAKIPLPPTPTVAPGGLLMVGTPRPQLVTTQALGTVGTMQSVSGVV
jgi:hypothetical protein